MGRCCRFQSDSGWVLTDEQAAVIDRAFLRAVGSGPIGQWGVAFFTSYLRLVEYAPLAQHLLALEPSPDDPMGLVADAARTADATLQPLLASADPATVMQSALRLQTSVCAGATASRFGQCTALSRELDNAHHAMEAGQIVPARASLTTYLSLLENAARRDVFDDVEALLLRGNVQMVLVRLQ